MQWRRVARAGGAARRSVHPIGMIVVAALAASAGGCSSLPQSARMSLASAAAPGATGAFESIDGPPPEVFRKLVASLNDEAGARKIAVVSRDSAATYRVRGYVSALVERDKTTFAWVWDVYDTDKRRTQRLSGEEAGPAIHVRNARSALAARSAANARAAAGAWAGADDQVVRRMAQSGMDQMAAFLNSGAAPVAAPVQEPSLLTLVSGRDDSPEAAGIFRLFGSSPETPAASPPPPAEEAEAPPPAAAKPAKSAKPKTRTAHATAAAPAAATDGRSPRP